MRAVVIAHSGDVNVMKIVDRPIPQAAHTYVMALGQVIVDNDQSDMVIAREYAGGVFAPAPLDSKH